MNKHKSKDPPLVSVACITYNQAKFIHQTIDSFLMQKTNFLFEILINDDASNDGTAEIIKEYQRKYPEIIRPTFHEKNLFSQGIRGMYIRFLLPKAKGKYIALCEGDDYWTDPYKLQKQVDFLEKRPDYALCFHPVKVVFEDHKEKDFIFPEEKSEFTVKKLLQENFIQTNSVMYRRQKYEDMTANIMPGDWYLHLYHAQFGKIGFIDSVMSTYRRHEGGIWWSSHNNKKDEFWKKYGIAHLLFFIEIRKIYGKDGIYRQIISSAIINIFNILADIEKKYQIGIINDAMHQSPKAAEVFIFNQSFTTRKLEEDNNEIMVKLKMQNEELKMKNVALERAQSELKNIYQSKGWRLLSGLRSVKHKITNLAH